MKWHLQLPVEGGGLTAARGAIESRAAGNVRLTVIPRPTVRKIREVMRYVGPRMLFIHPVSAIRHLISELK